MHTCGQWLFKYIKKRKRKGCMPRKVMLYAKQFACYACLKAKGSQCIQAKACPFCMHNKYTKEYACLKGKERKNSAMHASKESTTCMHAWKERKENQVTSTMHYTSFLHASSSFPFCLQRNVQSTILQVPFPVCMLQVPFPSCIQMFQVDTF